MSTDTPSSPADDVILAKARQYIELSNRGTTAGMEKIFAVDAVYEGGSDHPAADRSTGVRQEGRAEILTSHQEFFDSLERGTWSVPDANYVVTAPGVVEFDIVNVTIVPRGGDPIGGTAHEVMRFNSDGMAVFVGGYTTGAADPLPTEPG